MMLNRHNSMTAMQHQPIMPFKWRPFDLYNDIHVKDSPLIPPSPHNANVICERMAALSCVQCCQCDEISDHQHQPEIDQQHVMMCDGNVKEHQRRPQQQQQRHRQSSRGSSSSGSGSCASISTIGRYFVNDIDNSESNMDTIKSCGSVDCFCCKLNGQRNLINHKMNNSAHHQQQQQHYRSCRHTNCSVCYNEITISKCCTPTHRDISPKHPTIMNNSNSNGGGDGIGSSKTRNTKSELNRAVAMPFDDVNCTYKCERSTIGTLNHCESPSASTKIMSPPAKITTINSNENINSTTTFEHHMKLNNCCYAGNFDNNWMIVHKKRLLNDRKYTQT